MEQLYSNGAAGVRFPFLQLMERVIHLRAQRSRFPRGGICESCAELKPGHDRWPVWDRPRAWVILFVSLLSRQPIIERTSL